MVSRYNGISNYFSLSPHITKVRDIMIDHRIHRVMIGQNGEKIKEIRLKYPDVAVNFPDIKQKSNRVALRGPKKEVDACYKYMEVVYQELVSLGD